MGEWMGAVCGALHPSTVTEQTQRLGTSVKSSPHPPPAGAQARHALGCCSQQRLP